jgi:hypothetical protein
MRARVMRTVARHAAVVATAFVLAGAAWAQSVAPSASAPPPSPPRGVTPPSERSGCNTVEKPLSAGGASIAPEQAGQQKSWQPPGGEITFTVRSFVQIPADAFVLVCFRWKLTSERQERFITARPVHLDLTDGGRLLKVTVVVPTTLRRQPPPRFGGDGEYVGFYLVPLAEVRILVLGKSGDDGNPLVAADVSHVMGITSPFLAVAIALLTTLAAFVVLTIVCHRRLRRFGYGDLDPFLRIVATRDGYASLSQFQMILWTFVVAGSAVYVMVLSGDLIEITTGTLVLLGISGTVTVGAKLHDNAVAASEAVAGATPPKEPRRPRWSDFIVNEVDNQREIDIARVQMLYFTIVTALFVVMRVLTTYEIPEIPQGFQILMGISNAVYFGSKVAQPAANTAVANPPPAGADSTAQPPPA